VAAACTGSAAPTTTSSSTTTTVPTTTTTTQQPTTTAAPTTTTSRAPAPTTPDVRHVDVSGELPAGLLTEIQDVMDYATDLRNDVPAVAEGLVSYLEAVTLPVANIAHFEGTVVELQNGDSIAVAHRSADILLAVDDGTGWRIVGARLGDLAPWLGEEPRLALVLGSDARVGQNQQRFRADSIHLLSVVPEASAGAIVGFPRDSLVPGPDGDIKFSSLMAGRGPQIMLDTTRALTALPIEGYVVTGFKGFEGLIEALGGLLIDLPTVMRTGNDWSNFAAGLQKLDPTRALQLARIRKGLPGGDFARSFNQGLIMQAAMAMVQDGGIDLLPNWLFILLENAWTDLSTEDLLTLAASSYFLAPEDLVNIVLPGRVATVRGASVVLLDEEVEAIYRDLDDGLLATE
jgi:LCP family protein required for cell wall assembly